MESCKSQSFHYSQISVHLCLPVHTRSSTTSLSHQQVLTLPSQHFSCHSSIHLSPPIHQCIYSLCAFSTSALPRPLFHPSLLIFLGPFSLSIHLCQPPSIPHFNHPSFTAVTFFFAQRSFLSSGSLPVRALQPRRVKRSSSKISRSEPSSLSSRGLLHPDRAHY